VAGSWGSAGRSSSSRILDSWALSIQLTRVLSAVSWASRSADAAASVARRAARSGPKIRAAKNGAVMRSRRSSGTWTERGWSGWSAACLGLAHLPRGSPFGRDGE
jgi:hypothetical protein